MAAARSTMARRSAGVSGSGAKSGSPLPSSLPARAKWSCPVRCRGSPPASENLPTSAAIAVLCGGRRCAAAGNRIGGSFKVGAQLAQGQGPGIAVVGQIFVRDAHVPDLAPRTSRTTEPPGPGARTGDRNGRSGSGPPRARGWGRRLPADRSSQQMLSEHQRRIGLLDVGNRDRQSLGGRRSDLGADASGKALPRRLPCRPRISRPRKNDIQQPARCLAGSQAIHHRGLTGGITIARERRNDCVWRRAPKDIGARTIGLGQRDQVNVPGAAS